MTATALIAAVLLASTGSGRTVIFCDPPPISSQGVHPGATLYYQFVGSYWSEWLPDDGLTRQECAEQALASWNNTNTGVTFAPRPENVATNVALAATNLGGSVAGNTTGKTYDSDGFITGFGVQVTTDTNLVDRCDGVKKVVMHELGHGQGLGDANGGSESSVMNQLLYKDDAGGNLPGDVTSCDADQAFQANHDTQIICRNPPPCDYNDWIDQYGCCRSISPIVISSDGRQAEMTPPEVWFDLSGQGHPLFVGWTRDGHEDGFLAADRDGDGLISNGLELFGNETAQPDCADRNGFNALAIYDQPYMGGNLNNQIDRGDSIFSVLRLWFDANHDGVSAPSELRTLPDAGIVEISLAYKKRSHRDRFGNEFRYVAPVRFKNGRLGTGWDIFLAWRR